ncbi:hypothetical protein Scep_012090 [Stephania cephalantha]|uniref:Uncharacterized protein n=1 Tax=Stephania cephalantha TaxID=152367 RepID=A0AAP0P665_9MAGN
MAEGYIPKESLKLATQLVRKAIGTILKVIRHFGNPENYARNWMFVSSEITTPQRGEKTPFNLRVLPIFPFLHSKPDMIKNNSKMLDIRVTVVVENSREIFFLENLCENFCPRVFWASTPDRDHPFVCGFLIEDLLAVCNLKTTVRWAKRSAEAVGWRTSNESACHAQICPRVPAKAVAHATPRHRVPPKTTSTGNGAGSRVVGKR